MSLLSIFTDKIIGSIPEGQRNGMEETMVAIAGGAAGAATGAAITPEIANLARSAACGLTGVSAASEYASNAAAPNVAMAGNSLPPRT